MNVANTRCRFCMFTCAQYTRNSVIRNTLHICARENTEMLCVCHNVISLQISSSLHDQQQVMTFICVNGTPRQIATLHLIYTFISFPIKQVQAEVAIVQNYCDGPGHWKHESLGEVLWGSFTHSLIMGEGGRVQTPWTLLDLCLCVQTLLKNVLPVKFELSYAFHDVSKGPMRSRLALECILICFRVPSPAEFSDRTDVYNPIVKVTVELRHMFLQKSSVHVHCVSHQRTLPR